MRLSTTLLFLTFLSHVTCSRDFYKILEVKKKADDDEIKKAYRKQSIKWHPDQNPDNVEEATKMFYAISDAYDTLSDPEKRAKYDLGGEDAVNGNGGGGGGHGGGFHQGGDPFEQFRTFFQFFGDGQGGGGGGGFNAQFGGGGFHHQQAPPAKNLYDEKSGVTEISSVNDWNSIVGQRSEIILVDFYSPSCGPCQALKEEYISVAKTFKGIVKVCAVNCASHQASQICQSQKVANYPKIRMYGDNVVDFPDHKEKSSKNIGNWVSDNIPDVTVKLGGPGLDKFLTTVGTSAVLFLFTDKKQTPPLYKSLCRMFKSSVACATVLGFDTGSSSKFNLPAPLVAHIAKTPALLYLHDLVTFEGELFKGSMTSEVLSLFFSRIVSHRSRQTTVEQLTSKRKEDCSPSDSTTCVLLFADPASATQEYIVLRQMAQKYKNDPVKFFWVEGKSQFTKNFETIQQNTPLVAYRGKRGKYSVFEGEASNTAAVNTWIDNIVTGGSSLSRSVDRKPSHDEL